MKLPPVPIPSDASKAPILPGLPASVEMNDLVAFLVLISPGILFLRLHTGSPKIAVLFALPGVIASYWLVWKTPVNARRGWQRLLARLNYQFLLKKQYRSTWYSTEKEYMELVRVGKKDLR
ncbi:hypothetical protein Desaci_4788 (plasmid) [Desulfosporosinus acidiphilus SJ4]|uniref:Uncharacterized protein n=1 Tax=Desulfosporosinus acidiphilus (strain DSM 22704 / JCM 16185 / SJ4) TaxID=646529 RepID=I4DCT8_DESAJ|nr:hypothetical protein [Desulfosporosinus acidiphilus]AFM43612.1 hypothetical protein Desaci_4788 [Desulfosporosinus acidiphilus SJ4]